MFRILTLNNISPLGLARLPQDRFQVSADVKEPYGILLRSFKMHDMQLPDSLLAVGRAGAGTNNIPVAKLRKLGVPVFNTPGANANAVKELVIAGLLMAARNLPQALDYVRTMLALPAMQAWAADAALEKEFIDYDEPYRFAPAARR